MSVWIAQCDTASFSFTAVGSSKVHAAQVMAKTLNEHGRQYRLAEGWYDDYDVVFSKVVVGEGRRYGTDKPLVKGC